MSKFTIRPMAPADIPTLVDMIHELTAFHDDTGTASIASVTRDTNPQNPWWHTYMAEADGILIGYMVLIPLSQVADGLRGLDLNHMYIRASHRGQGIGRAFIETAKTHAKTNACTYMSIGTAPGNDAAQAAYLACGFETSPRGSGPRFRMQL
jgi:GNAT superfamily N-acetyltransferase